jgi:hypothetical protein
MRQPVVRSGVLPGLVVLTGCTVLTGPSDPAAAYVRTLDLTMVTMPGL